MVLWFWNNPFIIIKPEMPGSYVGPIIFLILFYKEQISETGFN